MTRLSILVPTLPGKYASFEDTLASVLRNQPPESEVIAAHDGSYLDPHNLREVGVRVVQVRAARTLTDLISAALSHCKADVVHILRPGTQVDEGWTTGVQETFADRRVAAAAPLLVAENQPDRLVTWGIDIAFGGRPRLVGAGRRLTAIEGKTLRPLAPSLWAAFYRRQPLHAILRRFAGRTTSLLDLEIGLTLRAIGLNSEPLPSSLVSLSDPHHLVLEYRNANGRDVHHLLARFWQDGNLTLVASSVARGLMELSSGLIRPQQARTALQRFAALGQRHERHLEQAYLAELRAESLQQIDEAPFTATTRRAA